MKNFLVSIVGGFALLSVASTVLANDCQVTVSPEGISSSNQYIVEGSASNIPLNAALEQLFNDPAICKDYTILWEPGINKSKPVNIQGPRYISEMIVGAVYAAGYKIARIGDTAFYIYERKAPYVAGVSSKAERAGFNGYIIKPGYISDALKAVGDEWGYKVLWQSNAGLEDFVLLRPVQFEGVSLQGDIALLEQLINLNQNTVRIKQLPGNRVLVVEMSSSPFLPDLQFKTGSNFSAVR